MGYNYEDDGELKFYGALLAVAMVVGVVGAFIEGPKKVEPKQTEVKAEVVEADSCMLPVYSPICMSRNVKVMLRDTER